MKAYGDNYLKHVKDNFNLETKDLDQGKTFKSTFLKLLNGKGALSTNVRVIHEFHCIYYRVVML